LVHGGLPTGAALVFLMAGPATNIATIGAIKKTFGLRTLAVYLLTIVVGSLAFAMLFDALAIDSLLQTQHASHEHAVALPLQQAAAIGLIAFFVVFASEDLKRFMSKMRLGSAAAPAETMRIKVDGLRCGGCVNSLEKALRATNGVDTAVVSLEDKEASITGDASEETVRQAILDAGYKPL